MSHLRRVFAASLLAACNESDDEGSPSGPIAGDPASAAIGAMSDFDDGSHAGPDEISVDPETERELIRTEFEVGFSLDATLSELNEALLSVDALPVSMLEGVPRVVVRIPDPGSAEGAHDAAAAIAAHRGITDVDLGWLSAPTELPDSPTLAQVAEYAHHAAAHRAIAAWSIPPDPEAAPWTVIVVDWFGHGPPSTEYFDVDVVDPTDFHDDDALADEQHGYAVLSALAARIDDEEPITGIAGMPIVLRAVDLTLPTSTSLEENRIVAVAETVTKSLVNLSLAYVCNTAAQAAAFCVLEYATSDASEWAVKVRAAGLEDRAVFVSGAGNTNASTGEASLGSNYNAAALLPLVDAAGQPALPLADALVVENVVTFIAAPHAARCLSDGSFHGGSIAAAGTDVALYGTNGGDTETSSGTSLSTPLVVGALARMTALDDALGAIELRSRLLNSATEPLPVDPDTYNCKSEISAPVLDVLAASLAMDEGYVRLARGGLVDVAVEGGAPGADGVFDEHDLGLSVSVLDEQAGALDWSRYDINGDGFTGHTTRAAFDLDADRVLGVVQLQTGSAVADLAERTVSDQNILCWLAWSELYSGDVDARDTLLEGPCVPKVTLSSRSADASVEAEAAPGPLDQSYVSAYYAGFDLWTSGLLTAESEGMSEGATGSVTATGTTTSTLVVAPDGTEFWGATFTFDGDAEAVSDDFLLVDPDSRAEGNASVSFEVSGAPVWAAITVSCTGGGLLGCYGGLNDLDFMNTETPDSFVASLQLEEGVWSMWGSGVIQGRLPEPDGDVLMSWSLTLTP